jgi:hypothetical protein
MQIAFTLPMLNFRPEVNQSGASRRSPTNLFPRAPEVASSAARLSGVSHDCLTPPSRQAEPKTERPVCANRITTLHLCSIRTATTPRRSSAATEAMGPGSPAAVSCLAGSEPFRSGLSARRFNVSKSTKLLVIISRVQERLFLFVPGTRNILGTTGQ